MEILLTGNTCFVTPAWVEMAFPEDHVLITCARGQPHPPRIRTITLDSKERIGQLVDSYEFDRIVYFSEYLTPHSEQEGELDRLRRVLQANRERPSQLLYLAGPEAVLTPFIGKSVLAQAAEALCRHYAETSRVQIKVLHLPYLYGTDCTGAPVGIAQLLTRPKSGELHFEEQALAPVAALCMEDLSELVLRVFDNWTPEWESLTAPVVFHWNYEQLGEAWKALCPGLTVTYGSDLIREYPPDDGQLRRAYGWFPRYDLLDDLPRFFRQEKQPRRKKWPERLSGFAARHRLLVPVLELLGAWGVSELLVRMTSTQAQFRVVDFRLAFIGPRARRRCCSSTSRPTGWPSSCISWWGRCAAMCSCAAPRTSALPRRSRNCWKSGCGSCGSCIRIHWRTSARSGGRSWAGETASARCMP